MAARSQCYSLHQIISSTMLHGQSGTYLIILDWEVRDGQVGASQSKMLLLRCQYVFYNTSPLPPALPSTYRPA